MKIKDPAAPATPPQLGAIAKMAKKAGVEAPNTEGMTKGEASDVISGLAAIIDGTAAAPAAEPAEPVNLAALAAQMEGKTVAEPVGAPFTADTDKPVLSLTLAQVKTALSWFPVVAAETDPTAADEQLEAALQLALAAQKPAEDLPKSAQYTAPAEPKAATAKTADAIGVVAGHYAIGPEGQTKFYRVQYGKADGKWAGFCFVDVQASDDYWPVKGATKFEVLEQIKADPMAAAVRYGKEIGKCWHCHKTLTDPDSIAQGMGDDCKAKLGL